MATLFNQSKNYCRSLRFRLADSVGKGFKIPDSWLTQHVAGCPRCRQRLRGFSRVELALTLVRTQRYSPDLLSRANEHAIGFLKNNVRHTSRAESLKTARPKLSFYKRLARYSQSVTNAAACLALMLLMRHGVFDSMDRIQDRGSQAVKDYYAKQVGDDQAMMDYLFEA